MEVSAVIPVCNEERALQNVLSGLKEALLNIGVSHEIIVVDDGSSDGSAVIARKFGAKVISHRRSRGYGACVKSALKQANGTYIVVVDADVTYPVEALPELWKLRKEYDMVVGARDPKALGGLNRRSMGREAVRRFAQWATGESIPDVNTGFRLFKKVDALKFAHLYPEGFSQVTTITVSYLYSGLTIGYVPIEYRTRVGKSKIKVNLDGFNFLFLVLRLIAYFRPLKIFIPVSLILLFAAAAVFAQGVFSAGKFFSVTWLILLLASLGVFLLGLVADAVSRRRWEHADYAQKADSPDEEED
ncbi:Glycosyltransferase AglJ [uncultured archaeon]|nr:Glycosyltransferase AglJ [uncultured archaeon]